MALYTPKSRYTPEELDDFALRDLIVDAEVSEEIVKNGGPFTGMSREEHIAYAAKCRAAVEKYRNGWAHLAMLS